MITLIRKDMQMSLLLIWMLISVELNVLSPKLDLVIKTWIFVGAKVIFDGFDSSTTGRNATKQKNAIGIR